MNWKYFLGEGAGISDLNFCLRLVLGKFVRMNTDNEDRSYSRYKITELTANTFFSR